MNDCPQQVEIELDKPEANEKQYEDLFWGERSSGSGFSFLPLTIFNQGAKPLTRMACSRYGIIHAINAQNRMVAEIDGMRWIEMNPEVMWKNYLKENAKAEKEGATLQSSLQQMVDLRLITGYTRLNGEESMKNSLRAFRPIYTGSKNCNWSSVRDDKRYELGTGYAHIFCILGFDESGWIAVNSYGPSNGVFHIDYKYTSSLFSCYALSDSRDEHLFS